jgi:hypothetical protein
MLGPEEEALLGALFEGSSAAAAIGAPLVPAGEQLRDDTRVDMAGTREGAARDRVEEGISGNSVVTDPACTTYAWSGLMVTATFDMCVLELTMLPLDGSITLGVSFFPTEFQAAFGALTVGDLSLDGTIGVRTGGNCRAGSDACSLCPDTDPECAEMRENQQTLWANLVLMSGEMYALALDDVTATSDAAATTVTGGGSISSSTASATFTATSLRWATGDCLPTSGTVLVTPAGGTAITVEPTATTPSTGIVNVTIPPFPAVPVMITSPCP